MVMVLIDKWLYIHSFESNAFFATSSYSRDRLISNQDPCAHSHLELQGDTMEVRQTKKLILSLMSGIIGNLFDREASLTWS